MTFNDFITLFGFILNSITVMLSVITLMVTIFSHLHQKEISYPKIRIKNIASFRKSTKFDRCLYFSKEDRRVFLLVKFNMNNFSPTKGTAHNFKLKCSAFKGLNALSREEIDKLSKKTQNFISAYADSNSKLINKSILSNPFENKIILLIFQLPGNRSFISKRRNFKVTFTYYESFKHSSSVSFSISGKHYADYYVPNDILRAVIEQEQADKKRKEELQQIEIDKLSKVLQEIINSDTISYQ